MRTPPEALEPDVPPLSSAVRRVGIVTLVVAIAGILSQAVVGLLAYHGIVSAVEYARGYGFKLSIALAVANLLVCIYHYHKTGMRIDVVTRVLSYVWILATCVFFVVREHAAMGR